MVEAALFIPVLLVLMFGMVSIARVTYTYFTLQKLLHAVARVAASQPGINFCDTAATQGIIEFALAPGGEDATSDVIQGFDTSSIEIRAERRDPENGTIGECECSISGCDLEAGGSPPEFIVVTMPDGFNVNLTIPGLSIDPIPLRPFVRMPVGG